MTVSVVLDQAELAVEPGGSARSEIRVANHGDAVARVRLAVGGPASVWAFVIPADLDVAAGATATTGLVIRVPRASEPAAGRYGFELVVSWGEDDGREAAVSGTVEVTAFADLSVRVQPVEGALSTPRQVTVTNDGNSAVPVSLTATCDDPDLEAVLGPAEVVAGPGQPGSATLGLRAAGRARRRGQVASFEVSALAGRWPDAEPATATGRTEQPKPASKGRVVGLGVGAVALVVVVALLMAGGEGDSSPMVAASGTTAAPGEGAAADCAVNGHIDQRVTGLTPEDIPKLPADYSFFEVASDGCSPVRWNPCGPVHYVINPANATPTGLADVREAFRRLGEVTGMTYVEDGMTDEVGTGGGRGRSAYQPQRYGERWAPILVSWQTNTRGNETTQIVGGGFPTLAGDVYVTGNLFLNPEAVTNPEKGTKVGGGFGSETGFGPIGPEGVTWGRIILHELAHIMGLGHVRDPSQLMYPETSDHTGRPVRFAPGDLAGMKLLSRDAGCLTTPPLDTPTRGISGRGGRTVTTVTATTGT